MIDLVLKFILLILVLFLIVLPVCVNVLKERIWIYIEERLKYIRHSLIKILVKKFRLFLFFLSLFTLPPLTDFILNNGFMRRKIFYINSFFLYSALWADKLHLSNKKH